VSDISFSDMHIQAVETDLDSLKIPASELFDYLELDEFSINFENKKGQAEIICFDEWKRNQI
jgi:hypothetical protein